MPTVQDILNSLKQPIDINSFRLTTGYCTRYDKYTSMSIRNQTITSCHQAWIHEHGVCDNCLYKKESA